MFASIFSCSRHVISVWDAESRKPRQAFTREGRGPRCERAPRGGFLKAERLLPAERTIPPFVEASQNAAPPSIPGRTGSGSLDRPGRKASRAGAGPAPWGAAATGGRCCPRTRQPRASAGTTKAPFFPLLPEMSHKSWPRPKSGPIKELQRGGPRGRRAAPGVTLDAAPASSRAPRAPAGTRGNWVRPVA